MCDQAGGRLAWAGPLVWLWNGPGKLPPVRWPLHIDCWEPLRIASLAGISANQSVCGAGCDPRFLDASTGRATLLRLPASF